jgi:hypothetical protein
MGTAATASTAAAGGSMYFYDVTASATRVVITSSGQLGIGTTMPTAAFHVVGNGYMTGTLTQGSDVRFKTDLEPISGALASLLSVRGYTYARTDSVASKREMGLIAQEVQEVFPELVELHDNRLRLNYSGMVAPLIEAVKELWYRLKDQEEGVEHARADFKVQCAVNEEIRKTVGGELAAIKDSFEALKEDVKRWLQSQEENAYSRKECAKEAPIRSAAGDELRARLQAEMEQMRRYMAEEQAQMRAAMDAERAALKQEREEMRAWMSAMKAGRM